MKINYVMSGVRRTGGVVTFLELGKRLIAKGHQVSITAIQDGGLVQTANGPKPSWEQDSPVEFRPVAYCGSGSIAREAMDRLRDWFTVGELVALQDLNSAIRLLCCMPKADIHVATYYLTAFPVALAQEAGLCKVGAYHMQHYEPLFFPADTPGDRTCSVIAERTYGLPLKRIANCTWLRDTVRGKHQAEATVCNHAISPLFKPPTAGSERKPWVLSLGKALRWKGLETLAEAMVLVKREVPEAELVLYGGEPECTKTFPFRWVEHPTTEELVRLYQQCSVVVCPSWYESFPAPPLEGMATGTPVVTTGIGVEDYARNGENCLIVKPKDSADMAMRIIQALKDTKLTHGAVMQTFVQNGLDMAARFSWDKTADRVEKLFLEALS